MSSYQYDLNDFLKFSEKLTNFSVFRLRGTGVAELYFKTVANIVGSDIMNSLLETFNEIESTVMDEVQKISPKDPHNYILDVDTKLDAKYKTFDEAPFDDSATVYLRKINDSYYLRIIDKKAKIIFGQTGKAEFFPDKDLAQEIIAAATDRKSLPDLEAQYKFMRKVVDITLGQTLFHKSFRSKILSDDKLGPVTRSTIKLWFIGTWYQLPMSWRERYGMSELDKTFIPSPTAYIEGLLWPSIGAHPPGAKAPGYGTWTGAPDIPNFQVPVS